MTSVLRGIEAVPLHQFLGMRVVSHDATSSRIELPAGPQALNGAGMLHGGVLYAIGDAAAYTALLGQMNDDEEAVTHDLHVSVMKPVPPGSTVRFEGLVERRGKTLAFLSVRVSVDGALVATARVTKSIIARR
jgi:uncharacterized protein (TIGR00369 family)